MKAFIEEIIGNPLSAEDWTLLSGIIKKKEVKKGDLLIQEGQVCKYIWYLEAGAVRYYENVKGDYKTTHFFLSPSMFSVYHSLITGHPVEINIEASEDLQSLALPYRDLKELYNKSHMLERAGRIMAEHQFMAEFDRRRMLLHMDALERYEYLEKNQPAVFQHYQLKDIATYIGITAVSLSRLRKYRIERHNGFSSALIKGIVASYEAID